MSMYGDNTVKQRIYDDLHAAKFGYVMDDPEGSGYIPAPNPTPEQVLVAALEVLADFAEDIRLEHRRYFNYEAVDEA